jgi:hypothetical protein
VGVRFIDDREFPILRTVQHDGVCGPKPATGRERP